LRDLATILDIVSILCAVKKMIEILKETE
jgi:hypothetical protein